jgi:hypothetical protein
MLVAVLLVGGPVFADPERSPTSIRLTDARILLPSVRVEVYEITAGGQAQLKPDWTENATANVQAAIETAVGGGKATIVKYEPPTDLERQETHTQVLKLHGLVGNAILTHRYDGRFRLPSMEGRFDWSLGPSAAVLREDAEADYALFVRFIEGHASGGRVAVNVAAAVLGGPIVTGRQTGVASLVDLRTGDILWFNRTIEGSGDLRTRDGALKALKRLLRELAS